MTFFPEQEIFMLITANTSYELGQAVRSARKKLGLTQPQLALAAGVGIRFIVELEAGKPTLRLEHVLRVVHSLGGTVYIDGMIESGDENTREYK